MFWFSVTQQNENILHKELEQLKIPVWFHYKILDLSLHIQPECIFNMSVHTLS